MDAQCLQETCVREAARVRILIGMLSSCVGMTYLNRGCNSPVILAVVHMIVIGFQRKTFYEVSTVSFVCWEGRGSLMWSSAVNDRCFSSVCSKRVHF